MGGGAPPTPPNPAGGDDGVLIRMGGCSHHTVAISLFPCSRANDGKHVSKNDSNKQAKTLNKKQQLIGIDLGSGITSLPDLERQLHSGDSFRAYPYVVRVKRQ